MLGRIKYQLLRWLLDDICEKSECNKCILHGMAEIAGIKCTSCEEGDVFYQARKVWDLEE